MEKFKGQVSELLKSGNFTIAYHDKDYCCLYEGKFKYDDLPEDGEFAEFYCSDGYAPKIVKFLAEALGGKVISI